MPTPSELDIQARLRADPRFQAVRRQHPSGRIDAATMRSLGYEVPEGYHFVWGGRSGYGSLMDNQRSVLERYAPHISAAMFAVAGGIGLNRLGNNPTGGGTGGTDTPNTGTNLPNPTGIGDKLKDWFTNPKNIAGLAALIPLLKRGLGGGGNSDSPFSGPAFENMGNEVTQGLALQRKRLEQTQPVFDTLVNMAYGSTPTRYRGAAPTGYPEKATEAPAGPYAYQSPRFG